MEHFEKIQPGERRWKEVTEFEKALEKGPEILEIVMIKHYAEGIMPFMEQVEALVEISNIKDEKIRQEAIKKMTEKDESKPGEFNMKYTPKDVWEEIKKEEE